MAVKQIFLLDAGYIFLDKSILTSGRGFGQEIKGVLYVALLEHTDGWILVDTALSPVGPTYPDGTWNNMAKSVRPLLREDNDLRVQLGKLNLCAEDIKYVINTHLHWDHAGGNLLFPKARFYVQQAEYRYAFYPDGFARDPYLRPDFDCGVEYSLVEGDQEIMDGVFVVQTPGHTPGHQSVLVKLSSGAVVIIAGDAIYTKENYLENITPGSNCDQTAAYASLNKLKMLQKLTGARMLFAHDPDLWQDEGIAPVCIK